MIFDGFFRQKVRMSTCRGNVARDVDRCVEEGKARPMRMGNGATYRLRPVPQAIVVQDTEDGAFRLVQHLGLRVHGGGGGGEVLLAATAQLGGDAIFLILLVYPDRGHYRRGSRWYPSRTKEIEPTTSCTRPRNSSVAGTKHRTR